MKGKEATGSSNIFFSKSDNIHIVDRCSIYFVISRFNKHRRVFRCSWLNNRIEKPKKKKKLKSNPNCNRVEKKHGRFARVKFSHLHRIRRLFTKKRKKNCVNLDEKTNERERDRHEYRWKSKKEKERDRDRSAQ